MMRKEELEIERRNVTVAQFFAYIRSQIRKHSFCGICADDMDIDYFKAGNDLNFNIDNKRSGKFDAPCEKEKSISKPYEMQTYIKNWDGTVYNMICQFDFWDDTKGFGYFYYLNTWND